MYNDDYLRRQEENRRLENERLWRQQEHRRQDNEKLWRQQENRRQDNERIRRREEDRRADERREEERRRNNQFWNSLFNRPSYTTLNNQPAGANSHSATSKSSGSKSLLPTLGKLILAAGGAALLAKGVEYISRKMEEEKNGEEKQEGEQTEV